MLHRQQWRSVGPQQLGRVQALAQAPRQPAGGGWGQLHQEVQTWGPRQLDLVRHGDAALAKAHREAAETALRNPYESPEACARRAAHHLAEAARHERPEARA